MEGHRALMSMGRQSPFPTTTGPSRSPARRWSRSSTMESRASTSYTHHGIVREAGADIVPIRTGTMLSRAESDWSLHSADMVMSPEAVDHPMRSTRSASVATNSSFASHISRTPSEYSYSNTSSAGSAEPKTKRSKREDLWNSISSRKTLQMMTRVMMFMGNSVPQTNPYTDKPFSDWSVRPGMRANNDHRF